MRTTSKIRLPAMVTLRTCTHTYSLENKTNKYQVLWPQYQTTTPTTDYKNRAFSHGKPLATTIVVTKGRQSDKIINLLYMTLTKPL